ncbi:MAG: hypothetical protein Q9227_004446 [Pyrenula ochraceoflavens]
MALLNATSIAGVLLLFYLSSFVLFAIIRIATGVSIQRIGYLSLRRISFTPREGLHLDLRGLGLSLHTPTFAQPTWISLRLTELKITFDPRSFGRGPKSATERGGHTFENGPNTIEKRAFPTDKPQRYVHQPQKPPSQMWKRLTNVKEKIKQIHNKIQWLRLVDVVAANTTIKVVDVGHVQIGYMSLAVDTRRKMVDRGKLFRHKKDPSGDQTPAEWILTSRSVMLALHGKETLEVLDAMSINVHGLLYKERPGLRDTSISMKLGRLHIPIDDISTFMDRSKDLSQTPGVGDEKEIEQISFQAVVDELDKPGSREDSIVQTVADSREFISSLLRGVQEIQMGLSFIRLSKDIKSLPRDGQSLCANVVAHEIGIDLHRLDQKTPAHRMYFSKDDIAHQALLAAVSVSVTLDGGSGDGAKLLYIPMATTTVRTTLPSKTISVAMPSDAAERNANVLFANLVVTSPSLDLEPRHLSQLLAIRKTSKPSASGSAGSNHRLISRLLPKASIKLSVQEPVVRFVLPVSDPVLRGSDDYDLLISSISSISLDIESSHSAATDMHYALTSIFRVSSHRLYYQNAAGACHDLLTTEALDLKTQLNATDEVAVAVSGSLKTFTVHLVRKEVTLGIQNILKHLKSRIRPEKLDIPTDSPPPSFLRRIPSWLVELEFEGSDFGLEIAGVDPGLVQVSRGLAIQLESWTANYVAERTGVIRRPSSSRRRGTNTSMAGDGALVSPQKSSPSKKHAHRPTDGRRLAIHVRGLEGFVIESTDAWDPQTFLSLPRFEVALSTSSDLQGSIFHINSSLRAVYLQFSLYRYYSLGVAAMVVTDAFLGSVPFQSGDASQNAGLQARNHSESHSHGVTSRSGSELLTVDVKASLVQVKAVLPADPPLMLQFYDVAAGRHRWSAPFLRSHLVRLHAEAPRMKHVWARVISMNAVRVDLRQSKRKQGSSFIEEKSLDVASDFVRLAVPHGLVIYKVFDNLVNTLKSVEQLHHRFKTRSNEYILDKQPEGPKNVPRVSLRSKALSFELEDDPFEWKLNCIYHVGFVEQKQRLAREGAFKMKVKKMEESELRRNPSRFRSVSASRGSQRDRLGEDHKRSKSADGRVRGRSTSRGRQANTNQMRYDPDGICAFSSSSKVSVKIAEQKLKEFNARSWKKRIDSIMQLQNRAIKDVRHMFAGADEPPPDIEESERILGIPNRPGLMTAIVSDLHLIIDKPSFPTTDCPKYLHRIGKGMPYDMKYSLLIPMNVSLDMGEARVMLRDYPLNLLHIPAIRPGQSARLPSWSLRTDLVIAEEFRDSKSTRHVKVDVIPPRHNQDGNELPGFALDVRRTVSPVKTYTDAVVDINTSQATTISWGTSYQPVIQDVMMIIESFTKPEVDPSDRVGFWDKIRLSFHSRILVNWKGDGDVHLRLKGSRDPYVVTGYGAGFVMCWRNDVQWAIHTSNDPKKLMTVTSGEYVLAIPDYSHQARNQARELSQDDASTSTDNSQRNSAVFKKVIMKLSGNVRWLAGLVLERDLADGRRSFDFKPHYDVVLRNPKHIKNDELKNYDAFDGFRSQHIHLSLAVASPVDRDWKYTNKTASNSYNTVHLTPRFFTHFFDWWSLFSGVMSLPVRQGRLWRGLEKSSKKFGRHLATIKYNLLLSPLFIAHIYKHKEAEEYTEDLVSATGLKLRLDSFMLDLHQRREQFNIQTKGKSRQARTSGMRINQTQLDFVSADVRAVSANIGGTNLDDLVKANDETVASYQHQASPNVDMARFTIPDRDFSWIDMDDFVELDWVLPSEPNPETSILPLAFSPRFTYFRQTDHEDSIHGDTTRTSPFGDEPTHYCVMSQDNDPRRVQIDLVKERLVALISQIEAHARMVGEQQLRIVRDGHEEGGLQATLETFVQQAQELEKKREFLEGGLRHLIESMKFEKTSADDRTESSSTNTSEPSETGSGDTKDTQGLYSSPSVEYSSDFNNRFVAHNVQLKWNNALRNIILRYSHQVSQRRGFVYYMSRRAVKFILDIVGEQSKSKTRQNQRYSDEQAPPHQSNLSSPGDEKDEEIVIKDRIDQLLNDAKRFVNADDAEAAESSQRPATADMGDNIAEEFTAQNSYHIRLIAPQIQLQSEKNAKSVILISAKGMQMKVISIMDKARVSDDVSGLVQRRFSVDMDGAQFFVTTQKKLFKVLHLYSANRYGNPPNSAWPPWVTVEVMFDFENNPFGFERIIQKTSAGLRYNKYNTLRLKYNDEVATGEDGHHVRHPKHSESRMDHLWVNFPRVRAICDSQQYYTMYIIVLDLLLYSEPLEKVRSERLEKIMLASDFSDLRGAPEIASSLQERIRQLEDLKLHFQVNAKYLDRDGWQDRVNLEKDLASCEDELFFIMKAITTSQRKSDDRNSSQSTGLLRWYLSASEIVWHLMLEKDEPLAEFQLNNAAYERIDNSDGSNNNGMEIQYIHGLNLLPSAIYPEMVGPYVDMNKGIHDNQDQRMLSIQWYMLEAIAGIPVLENFEVSLHPLKVQLERELGKRLFEYAFPGTGSNAFDHNFSPFMVKHMAPLGEDDDSDTELTQSILSARPDTPRASRDDMQSSTRPGTMSSRLRPTLALPHSDRPKSAHSQTNGLGIVSQGKETHRFRFFQQGHAPASHATPQQSRAPSKRSSAESLRAMPGPPQRSMTSMSDIAGTVGKSRKSGVSRASSKEEREKATDDISQMMSRASNYMTLAQARINSVVLCLSYKGKGERNIEDVHDLVFRMPVLEYRNKTWSNLDLALRLKKDVIKALLSHTGAIIGNKLAHHRPNKQHIQRLRELVSSSQILHNGDSHRDPATERNSDFGLFTRTVTQTARVPSPRHSFASSQEPSPLLRQGSYASSLQSSTTSSAGVPGTGSSSGLSPDMQTTSSDGQQLTLPIRPFARHFTSGPGRQAKDQSPEDNEERDRRKSVMLFGKKILGSLG